MQSYGNRQRRALPGNNPCHVYRLRMPRGSARSAEPGLVAINTRCDGVGDDAAGFNIWRRGQRSADQPNTCDRLARIADLGSCSVWLVGSTNLLPSDIMVTAWPLMSGLLDLLAAPAR